MPKIKAILLGSFMFLFVCGCSNDLPKPKDLPPLVPCEITITQEDKPLAGALVELRDKAKSTSWSTDGVTDANGIAKIRINGTFPGVPEGEYLVLVTKSELSPSQYPETPPSDPVKRGEWNEARALESRQAFNLVALQYADPKKTPLSVTISKENGKAAFDVGKAIREKMK